MSTITGKRQDGNTGIVGLDNSNNLFVNAITGIVWSTFSITNAGTYNIKSSSGTLGPMVILGGTAGTISIYNNANANSPLLVPTFTLGSTTPVQTIPFNNSFSALTIVTTANTAIFGYYL